jgi:membrane protein involved in colicin uptake
MRRLAAGLLAMLWLVPLWAQDAAPGPSADRAEMENIQASRVREGAAFDAEEADCYQRFAVSGCLKSVQSRRRAAMAKLRHQEALLHEREAAQRGAEERQRIADKAREKAQQDAERRANGSADDNAGKLREQQDKRAAHAARAGASATPPSVNKPAGSGPDAAKQAANRESYARKLADAEKKRQDVAKRQMEKSGKNAAPLPLPP